MVRAWCPFATCILVPKLIARFFACCRKHQNQGGAGRRDEEGILVDRLRPGSRSGSAQLESASKFQRLHRKLYVEIVGERSVRKNLK